MNGLNRVQLIGRLGSDPQSSVLPNGTHKLQFKLAVGERRQDKAGNWSEHTEWVPCSLLGKRAESLASMLSKGMPVYVEGTYSSRSYEKDGQKRTFTEVSVKDVTLFTRRDSNEVAMATDTGATRAAPKKATAPSHDFADTDYSDDIPF